MPKQVKAARTAAKPSAKTKTTKVIQLLVKQNPKRGQSRTRFGFYKTGMSVDAYVAKCEAAGFKCGRADLAWDTAHQFIAIR